MVSEAPLASSLTDFNCRLYLWVGTDELKGTLVFPGTSGPKAVGSYGFSQAFKQNNCRMVTALVLTMNHGSLHARPAVKEKAPSDWIKNARQKAPSSTLLGFGLIWHGFLPGEQKKLGSGAFLLKIPEKRCCRSPIFPGIGKPFFL
jgi:hypothetical protein